MFELSHFDIWSAVLAYDELCERGVRVFDAYGVLQLLLINPHYSFASVYHGHGSLIHAQRLVEREVSFKGPYAFSYSAVSLSYSSR